MMRLKWIGILLALLLFCTFSHSTSDDVVMSSNVHSKVAGTGAQSDFFDPSSDNVVHSSSSQHTPRSRNEEASDAGLDNDSHAFSNDDDIDYHNETAADNDNDHLHDNTDGDSYTPEDDTESPSSTGENNIVPPSASYDKVLPETNNKHVLSSKTDDELGSTLVTDSKLASSSDADKKPVLSSLSSGDKEVKTQKKDQSPLKDDKPLIPVPKHTCSEETHKTIKQDDSQPKSELKKSLQNIGDDILSKNPFRVKNEAKPENKPYPTDLLPPKRTLLANAPFIYVSTVDGHFYAIEKYTGRIKWRIKEDPVVQVSFSERAILLPDPTDGNLYVVGHSDSDIAIKKLPYSIPELVSMSPTRSSDGTFCTGYKRDFWLSVDMNTGFKTDVFSSDKGSQACPSTTKRTGLGYDDHNNYMQQSLLIGRSQHTLVVYDRKTKAMLWNVTYNDYSAHSSPDSSDDTETRFLTSSQKGTLVVLTKSGNILWALRDGELSSPIVAIYSLSNQVGDHHRSMVKEDFTSYGDDALELLVESARANKPFPSQFRESFQPSLYIETSSDYWYALTTYVLSSAKLRFYKKSQLLLEGPGTIHSETMKDRLTGLYVIPDQTIVNRAPHNKRVIDASSGPPILLGGRQNGNGITFFDFTETRNDIKLVIITVLSTVVFMVLPFLYYQWRKTLQALESHSNNSNNGSTSHLSTEGSLARIAAAASTSKQFVPNDWVVIGNIAFDPACVLGRGCEGTFVYKGLFDSRQVAVKRMLPDCFAVASKEVELLRLSDHHPNVVRYFCTEHDSHFRYIALELCDATVQDYAKDSNPVERFHLEPSQLLNQALQGLSHLHNLDIVHRDLKPTNILLCRGAGQGFRVVISDFGLCKQLSPGRCSFSKKSGLTGTEGWIAPEMFEDSCHPTCAVDIFSAGCVCFFVLSKGKHPFGETFCRQKNILEGNYNLGKLALDYLSCDLIKKMIELDPRNRLSISGALKHPFFWSPDKQLRFLLEASDRLEKLPSDDPLFLRVESCAPSIIGIDWSKKLDLAVTASLLSFRGYRTHRIFDLIRAIRNKRNHFRELEPEVQNILGFNSDDYIEYFTSRFPPLLTYLYNAFTSVRTEYAFENYFDSCDPDYFVNYYRDWMKENELKESELEEISTFNNSTDPQRSSSNPYLLFRRKTFKAPFSRHSDSDILIESEEMVNSGSVSKYRSPAMQKLHLKSLKRTQNSCSSSEEKLVPPGLTCSQENLILIDTICQEMKNQHSSSLSDITNCQDQDEDLNSPSLRMDDQRVLFRIDSQPFDTAKDTETETEEFPVRDDSVTVTPIPEDTSVSASTEANQDSDEDNSLLDNIDNTQIDFVNVAKRKKTRRGKKAKKPSPISSFDLPIDVSD